MCIHRLDRKTSGNRSSERFELEKLTWMEKIIWTFLSRKLKLKKLLKYLKSKQLSARKFDCGECFKIFFGLREINWKIARKGTAPPFGRSRENTIFFAKPRPNSLKYFRENWKPHQKFREYFFTSRLIYYTLVSHTLVPIKFIGHCIKPNWRP